MSKSTRAAAALPDLRTVYAEWLRARTKLAELDADGEHDDDMPAAYDAVVEAERKMLQAPAKGIVDIRIRAEMVQEMFAAADAGGEPTDSRHRLMLSTLVSEILSDVAED